MEEKILLAELTKNCDGKRVKLLELLKTYELACIGYDMQFQQEKDVYNRVLSENEFFCDKEFSRETGFKVGDRITDETYLFLLSDDDFHKVSELARPIFVEKKITDENGYFLTDWVGIKVEAMNALVDYIICEIVPSSMRGLFSQHRRNVIFEEKLINILKKAA